MKHDRSAGAEPSGIKALADEHPWLLTSLAAVGLVAAGGAISGGSARLLKNGANADESHCAQWFPGSAGHVQ